MFKKFISILNKNVLGIKRCNEQKEKKNTVQNHSRYLLVQSQQQKHQSNIRNLFKVNNKDSSMQPIIFHQANN